MLKTQWNLFIFMLMLGLASCGGSLEVTGEGEDKVVVIKNKISSLNNSTPASSDPETINNKWNEHIQHDGVTKIWNISNPSACNAASDTNCLHTGEILVIDLELGGCDGVEIEDNLGVFNWRCAKSGSRVMAISMGLKVGKGLSDILDNNRFKKNYIKVYADSNLIMQSESLRWWDNNIVNLSQTLTSPASHQVINTGSYPAGTVFVVSSDLVIDGLNFANNNYSIATIGSAKLEHAGTAANNCEAASGEVGTNDISALICAGSQDFLWIEGNIEGMSSGVNIHIESGRFININNVQMVGGSVAMNFNNSIHSNLRSISSSRVSNGIILDMSDDNRLSYIDSNMSAVDGLRINASSGNILSNIKVTSNVGDGLALLGSSENHIVTNVMASNNGSDGVLVYSASNYNTFAFITTINNGQHGFNFDLNTDRNALNNLLSLNNTTNGLNMNSADWNKIYNLALGHNGSRGLRLIGSGSYDNTFGGIAMFGNNGSSDCIWEGLTDRNNIASDCSSSTTTIVQGIDFSGSIMAKVSDSLNMSNNITGANDTDNITDTENFSSFMHFWGVDGGMFTSNDNRGACVDPSGSSNVNCHIWDTRLKSNDTLLLDTSNNTSGNESFTAGSACPSAVNGDMTLADDQSNTFLVNAVEKIGDCSGDDDGLCEDGEACIYAPNFGMYQGHGAVGSSSCNFNDASGSISAATIYSYSSNGI
jgi:hypothetical protein